MLGRTGRDWLVGMFEVYFDDSGTHAQSDIAIAACYISTVRGWKNYVEQWNDARVGYGFDVFHMAEFAAPASQSHKPFCDWDKPKRDLVYDRLAEIINNNKRIGIAVAVPKKPYDAIPERIRRYHGLEHYTFAVRMCLMRIMRWREESSISIPMQYFFDWEMSGSRKRAEISKIFDTLHESWEDKFGMQRDGYSFQHKEEFKPLQAADILAWQMNNHMRKIMPIGHDDLSITHPRFSKLRVDQNMDLGFFTENQLRLWVKQIEDEEAKRGPFNLT
jgi:hypothetical protein